MVPLGPRKNLYMSKVRGDEANDILSAECRVAIKCRQSVVNHFQLEGCADK